MGRFFLSLILVVAGQAANVHADSPVSKNIYIGISDVYVPDEVKANGDAYVVVSGLFPNSCYSWNRAEVTSKSATMYEVRLKATVSQTMCLMVLVPYSKEVVIGRLAKGDHTLRFISGDDTFFERTLTIK